MEHKSSSVRIFYSMTVCDMKAGEEAKIVKIELSDRVKERLKYLNVTVGASLFLLKVSPFKRTFLIQARSAKVAVGREVAKGIAVCRK